ncbi:MAG: PEP-CTERM sorting domain-containing protein [Planctomycetota bacterium]
MKKYLVLAFSLALSALPAAAGSIDIDVTADDVWTSPGDDVDYGSTGTGTLDVFGAQLTIGSKWESGYSGAKTFWNLYNGASILLNSSARINNNQSDLINARDFVVAGDGTFELLAGYNADLGSEVNPVGGLSTLVVADGATYVTNANQNLPSIWKYTMDKTNQKHKTHHGLLTFKNTNGSSPTWQVRNESVVYDGGISWDGAWTLDIADGLSVLSDTAYEQSVVGPHVHFGTYRGATAGAVLTKIGQGELIIARGGIQGYIDGDRMDIQAGTVEFNSDPGQPDQHYYTNAASGQNLEILVADGAAVKFHSYTWPYDTNWAASQYGTPSVDDYGTDNTHRIKSITAGGYILVGGLTQTQANNLPAETAAANDAKLYVKQDVALTASAVLEIVLGADDLSDDFQVLIDGMFSQNGTLKITNAGNLGVGQYDLFDAGTFTGSFAVVDLGGFVGAYDNTTGVLDIQAIPEPATMGLLAGGCLYVIHRRRHA